MEGKEGEEEKGKEVYRGGETQLVILKMMGNPSCDRKNPGKVKGRRKRKGERGRKEKEKGEEREEKRRRKKGRGERKGRRPADTMKVVRKIVPQLFASSISLK